MELQVAQLLATLAIGGFAALIAWRQWKTAQDKVKLDLFDRRFAVFMDARRLVSEALSLGEISDPALPNEIIAKGRYLFGHDIQDQLVKLHALCTRIEVKDMTALKELNDWLDQFMECLRPYMSMGDLRS